MTSPDDVVRFEQHPDRIDAVVLAPTGDETVGSGPTVEEALDDAVAQMPEELEP